MTFLICFVSIFYFFSANIDYGIKFYLRKLNLHMYFGYTYESRNTWKLTTKLVNILLGVHEIILSFSYYLYT